jgi:hypothetical protein
MAIDIVALDTAVITRMGEAMTYTPDGGPAVSLTGFFQEPDETPETGEIAFTTTGPMVSVLKTDVPTPTKLDTIVRDSTGQNYNVKDFELDEGEIVILDLEETP